MEEHILLMLAATLFAYGLLARKIAQADITAPMLFTALGIACGPAGLGWISATTTDHSIKVIAEITLILVLFSDAAQIRFKHLIQFERYPMRLLMIGLPLTVIAGTIAAYGLFQLPWFSALILAIILTPTDAALAKNVMEKKTIDRNLRHSINVESGLNDGIALPVLLLAIAVVNAGGIEQLDTGYWLEFISLQLIFGTLIGILIGRAGGFLINFTHKNRWISPMYQRLSSISLAIIAFSAAELLHGNGFIAVFLAGLSMQTKHKVVIERIKEFGEAEGQLLTLAVFFIFGAVFIPAAWPHLSQETLLYAFLSLTLVRMIPVWISLIGTGLSFKAKGFLAWFGPRGVASILYLLLVIDSLSGQAGSSFYNALLSTTVATILLSVFLHGLSTSLWINTLNKESNYSEHKAGNK